MDSTDRGLGGDLTEVEPYGHTRLRQRAVQGVQSTRTDVRYLKNFRLVTTGCTKTALLPVVHPARGFSYFWISSMSTESSKSEGGSVLHRKGRSRRPAEEWKRNTYIRALVIYADNTFEISRHVGDVVR